MICSDCKYRNQDESAWPCKHCTPDDRRYEAETDHEMLRRLELARLRQQLATVTAERGELVEALDEIRRTYYPAGVLAIADAALAKLGADKKGE